MLVIVEWFEGRSAEQRKEFAAGIGKVFAEAGITEKVGLIFHETPLAATGHGINQSPPQSESEKE